MMDLVFPHTFVPWFRSVAPHIHAYRGKTFVVGIAGELIAAGKEKRCCLRSARIPKPVFVRQRIVSTLIRT